MKTVLAICICLVVGVITAFSFGGNYHKICPSKNKPCDITASTPDSTNTQPYPTTTYIPSR